MVLKEVSNKSGALKGVMPKHFVGLETNIERRNANGSIEGWTI